MEKETLTAGARLERCSAGDSRLMEVISKEALERTE